MSLRVKVYGLLALFALAGGGYYAYKTKPSWFGSVAQAKGTGDKDKKQEKEATPVELALVKRSEIAAFLSSTANLEALARRDRLHSSRRHRSESACRGRRLRQGRSSPVFAR